MADGVEAARLQSKVISECLAPLQAAIREVEEYSRRIPAAEDFHFFANFERFRQPASGLHARSRALLSRIAQCGPIRSSSETCPWPDDDGDDETYDWLVNVQDDVFEHLGKALDEMGVGAGKGPPEFLLDHKLKKAGPADEQQKSVRVASKRKQRPPVPFHVKNLARPQDRFDYPVDNSNQPFRHLPRDELFGGDRVDASKTVSVLESHARSLGVMNASSGHPLKEELDSMAYMESFPATAGEPQKPKSLSETPFTYVESLSALEALAAKLQAAQEFAVDLENHHYRSFQGFVCLMQVSTRLEDFVVDTLTLRDQIGPALRGVFANPSIRKVIHGSDKDILWLQRDFKIYVCNSFDTGQAARVLQMDSCGLAHLLQKFCGVQADKRYQLADWRLRPLTAEMLRYAREDTHYLLYIHDKLKEMLLDDQSTEDLYVEVCKRSRDLCLELYEKELYSEASTKNLYGLANKNFQPEQLAIVTGLHAWRDRFCRKEDESTGYVLPNNLLLRLAEEAPEEPKKLQAILKSGHPVASIHATEILEIIRLGKSSTAAAPDATVEVGAVKLQREVEQLEQPKEPGISVSLAKAVVVLKGTSSMFASRETSSTFVGCSTGQSVSPAVADCKRSDSTVQLIKKSSVADALFRPVSRYIDSEDDEDEDTIAKVEKIKASVALPFTAVKPVVPEFQEQEFEDVPSSAHEEATEPVSEETARKCDKLDEEMGDFIELEQVEQEQAVKDSTGKQAKGDELPLSLNQRYGKKAAKRKRRQESQAEAKKLKITNEKKVPGAAGAAALPAFSVKKKDGLKAFKAFDPSRDGPMTDAVKGGRKRQVFPQSGNRSATFK